MQGNCCFNENKNFSARLTTNIYSTRPGTPMPDGNTARIYCIFAFSPAGIYARPTLFSSLRVRTSTRGMRNVMESIDSILSACTEIDPYTVSLIVPLKSCGPSQWYSLVVSVGSWLRAHQHFDPSYETASP